MSVNMYEKHARLIGRSERFEARLATTGSRWQRKLERRRRRKSRVVSKSKMRYNGDKRRVFKVKRSAECRQRKSCDKEKQRVSSTAPTSLSQTQNSSLSSLPCSNFPHSPALLKIKKVRRQNVRSTYRKSEVEIEATPPIPASLPAPL
jgi:hypothetical protein